MVHAPSTILPRDPWVSKRLLTVAEYHRMGDVGILTDQDRVELIEGEVLAMAPIGSPHANAVVALTHTLVEAVGRLARVSVQNPVQLGDVAEPQPDMALLKPHPGGYRSRTPSADDVLLVVEVADSSLEYDRRVKRPLYARHGIPEMWIVNVEAGEVEVCRLPTESGYASVEAAGRDVVLAVGALPGVTVKARDFLD